jgi:hypothetical protein
MGRGRRPDAAARRSVYIYFYRISYMAGPGSAWTRDAGRSLCIINKLFNTSASEPRLPRLHRVFLPYGAGAPAGGRATGPSSPDPIEQVLPVGRMGLARRRRGRAMVPGTPMCAPGVETVTDSKAAERASERVSRPGAGKVVGPRALGPPAERKEPRAQLKRDPAASGAQGPAPLQAGEAPCQASLVALMQMDEVGGLLQHSWGLLKGG